MATMATMATTATMAAMKQASVGYIPGRARWATVRVEVDNAIYVGRLYVPETKKRVSDILSDERLFISLIDVSINHAADIESFVAINKRHIRTIRIIDEGQPENPRPAMRPV